MAVIILALAGVMLSALFFVGGERAQAQLPEGDLVCQVGTLQDDTCVEVGDDPEPGDDVCPTETGAVAADGECFQLVPAVGGDTCPTGTSLDPAGTVCRQAVAKVALTCPEGFVESAALDDTCFRAEPATQAGAVCPLGSRGQAGDCYTVTLEILQCADGELRGDTCVITGALPVSPGAECPVSDLIFEDGNQCFVLQDRVDGQCPISTTAHPGSDQCRRQVDLRPLPSICAAGFSKLNGDCFRFETPISGLGCPAEATVDAFGLCRLPVADRQAVLYCPNAAQELQGSDCVTTVVPPECTYNQVIVGCVLVPNCAQNFASGADFGGRCARYEPATIPGMPNCPDGARGVTDACYILVAKGPVDEGVASCPVNAIEDTAGECRRLVANARAPYVCAEQNSALAERVCIFVASTIEPGAPGEQCGPGFVADGDLCTSTEPALLSDPLCPDGARGSVGACFADAMPFPSVDAFCAEGQFLSVAACVVYDEAATTTPLCPVSATVLQDGDECYVLFTKQTGIACPVNTTPDPNGFSCRRPIDPIAAAATCFEGFEVFGASCARFDAPIADQVSCLFGSELAETGACRIAVGDAQGIFYCENPSSFLQNDECIFTTTLGGGCTTAEAIAGDCGSPVPVCPSGYSPDDSLGGVCARFEPASQRPDECPAGALGIPGDCYILVSKGLGLETCPADLVEDANGDCRQPVSDAAGAYFCSDPSAALNGKSCVFTAGFVSACDEFGNPCPEGPGGLVCPVSATVFADGDECFELVSFEASACPTGTTNDPGSTLCREPVDLIAGDLACADNFELLDGQCLRFSDPLVTPSCTNECNGELQSSQGDAVAANDTPLTTVRPTAISFADCAGGTATYSVFNGEDAVAAGSLVEGDPGVYTGSYSLSAAGTYELVVRSTCPDGSVSGASQSIVFIDPSGVIVDCVGNAVAGAQITLLRADADGQLLAVANGDSAVMDPSINTQNPSFSDADGRYRWDVVAGNYQVRVAVSGQSTQTSDVLAVPPARTDVDFVFADLNCRQTTSTPSTTAPLPLPNIVNAPASGVAPAAIEATAESTVQPGLAVTGSDANVLVSAAVVMLALGLSGHVTSRRLRRDPLDS